MQEQQDPAPELQDAAFFSSTLGMIVGIWSLIAPWFFFDSPIHMFAAVTGLIISGVAFHVAKKSKAPSCRRMAIVGLVTSGIGFAIMVLLLSAILPGLLCEARQSGCLNNTKKIGMAMRLYSSDYDDRIPPAEKWQPALITYLPTKERKDLDGEFPCCLSAREKRYSYGMNSAVSTLALHDIHSPASTVFVFDCSLPMGSASGGREAVDFRHNEIDPNMANIGFIDGHAKAIRKHKHGYITIDQLRWKP